MSVQLSSHSSRPGSLGHQFLAVLKAAFRPGYSRHQDKKSGKARHRLYSIETMKKYTAEAFTLAKYIKANNPECRRPEMLTPEICASFIRYLVNCRLDGGTIGRYQAMIRKLDSLLRQLNRLPADGPYLLPTVAQGGQPGFRSNRSTQAYTDEQLVAILNEIEAHGARLYAPVALQVICLMITTGLRIREVAYLRADNIDLASRRITLDGNRNRSKGGRPRTTEPFDESAHKFIMGLQQQGANRESGHIFENRYSLPNHVRAEIRRACWTLGIECLGSHGFRKFNAQTLYAILREEGAGDEQALRRTSRHLGHNRTRDTRESYLSVRNRQ